MIVKRKSKVSIEDWIIRCNKVHNNKHRVYNIIDEKIIEILNEI